MKTECILPTDLSLAVSLLQKGEVVAFPTETVYGLGGLISHPEALQKIYQAKGRPSDNPLIVHVASVNEIDSLVDRIPDDFYALESFLPGPLTIVFPKKKTLSLHGGLQTIAIRMPMHPVARRLITEAGAPIAAPSANLSGRPSPTSAQHVIDDLGGKIPLVIDGGMCDLGIESTVISLVHPIPTLLRPGSISQDQLEKALGKKIEVGKKGEAPLAPGMKYRHYAPDAKVHLFSQESELLSHLKTNPKTKRFVLPTLSAKDLYAKLRDADRQNCKEVCILINASMKKDAALMNRLHMATL